MNIRDQLDAYLRELESRLRLGTSLRGAALLALAALGGTVLLVMITNALAFSEQSLTGARVALFLCLALAVGFGLALPLLRLNRRKTAGRAEQAFPEFEQRLVTFAEHGEQATDDPFLELLAADTIDVARHADARRLVPGSRLLASLGAAAMAAGLLIWMIAAGPGYLGHGAALLWAGATRDGAQPFYDIKVSPGDATVRRKGDQLVTAHLIGLQVDRARLYARYHSTSKWEQVEMQPQPGGAGFEFLFAGLPESVEYYVEAGRLRSRHFNLRVLDLPAVKRIRVTYRFPRWAGIQNVVEEHGGDLRAVEGTEADLEIETDRQLKDGLLVVDSETQIRLAETESPNRYKGTIRIQNDGLYHVAVMDQGQTVRLTEDFFIEARQESAPSVRIVRPGRDYRSSPIEEVTVAVEAQDDFALQEMNLHYSVNGGPEQTVALLKQRGAKEGNGSTLLALEDFQLVPGDVVSLYATARDARAVSRTDMFFIEAQPFEKEYSQSQQSMGGGGGGEQDQNRISARQKEIIAATWNQLREKNPNRKEAAETARFLSDVQSKLRDQAQSLARRMQSRELSRENQEFNSFAKDMTAAAAAMTQAAEQLKGQSWKEALPHEQKALQHLLRAEATFRQIQVAFGSRGGGGRGGGAARDLENLFDLELDTEKNQYETGQQNSAEQRAREIDEALQRLEQLARRQQELAQQQRQNRQSFQQRWQQEMLRREAEQLQRRMEQMARGDSSSSSQQGEGQSQSSSSASSQQSGSQGTPRAMRRDQNLDPRVQQALERLRQATEDMRRAASQDAGSGQGGDAESRRAAERLSEARDLLGGMRRQEAADQVENIAREADRLAQQQRAQADRLRQIYGSQAQTGNPSAARPNPNVGREETERLAAERQQIAADLERLERQMQNAVRDMASTQRSASSKLRQALGEMQQSELGLRLKYSGEWIRRGLGAYAYMREAPVTNAMERLREQVREAQRALQSGPPQQRGLESALERVERLRSQMESLARDLGQRGQGRQQGQQGQQQGQQGQPGQQGQQGQGAQGEQAGQTGGQRGRGGPAGGFEDVRQGGERGEADFSAMNRGGYLPELGRAPEYGGPAAAERTFREGIRDLSQLRQSVRENPELARDLQELIREMQRLDPSRFPGNPELVERLRSQVLTGLEQLELQLRRQLDDTQSGQVRSSAPRPVPPGYQESVAEYFRRLSKGQ